MRKYIVVLLFLFIFPFRSSWTQEACSSTNDNSCAVYAGCIEKNCNCGSTDYNYSNTFGPKYCDRFGKSTKFTGDGVKWRDKTLSCLKNEISHAYLKNIGPPCNCKEIQKAAVDSHSFCYTQAPSVCNLSDQDIKVIANIVDKKDILSLGFQGAAEIWTTFVDCHSSIGTDKSVRLFSAYLSQEWDDTSTESVEYVHTLINGAVTYSKNISDKLSEAFGKVRDEYPVPIDPPG